MLICVGTKYLLRERDNNRVRGNMDETVCCFTPPRILQVLNYRYKSEFNNLIK